MDQSTSSAKGRFSFFRILLIILLFALLFITWSQRRSPHVIASGKIYGTVTLWENPCGSPSNGGMPFTEGRVEVYDNFIIVTTPGGVSHLSPNGYHSQLSFKPGL